MKFRKSFAGLIAAIFVTSVVIPVSLIGITESGDEWSLVIDGKSLELIPELEEYCWVLDRPPYEPWDRIALRRLVKIDGEPIGTLFIFPGTWSSGEHLISDDVYCQYLEAIDADQDKINEIRNKIATRSICHYLALRGFDVYAIDYRTHFVPITYTQDDLKFMKSWGWKMYVEDAELAIDKTKEVSGADKIFLGGESFGGNAAMNYASMHWEEDLDGIVLLDGGSGGNSDVAGILSNMLPISIPISIPFVRPILELMTHLLGLYAMDVAGDMGPLLNTLMSTQPIPHYPEVIEYGMAHPLDPPLDPVTGKRLEPTTNPATGEPFENYLEWIAGHRAMSKSETNLYEGYNDVEAVASTLLGMDRYWPMQIGLETVADSLRPGRESNSGIWNRDYYNFYAHYSEIDVPLIAFISGFGLMMWGEFNPEIKNQDVTGYTYPEWGHLDIYTGIYNPEMVNEPTYQWLIDRL